MTNLAKIKRLYLWKPSICKTFWTALVNADSNYMQTSVFSGQSPLHFHNRMNYSLIKLSSINILGMYGFNIF